MSKDSFSKYGKGASLLFKMGYVAGEGLGKSHQGIIEPIETQVRQKGVGVGGDDADKKYKPMMRSRVVDDWNSSSDDDENDDDDIDVLRKSAVVGFNKAGENVPDLFTLIEKFKLLRIEVPIEIMELCDSGQPDTDVWFNLRSEMWNIVRNANNDTDKLKYLQYEIGTLSRFVKQCELDVNVLVEIVELINDGDASTILNWVCNVIWDQISDEVRNDIERLILSTLKETWEKTVNEWDYLSFDSTVALVDLGLEYKEKLKTIQKYDTIVSAKKIKLGLIDGLTISTLLPKLYSFFINDWKVENVNIAITIIEEIGDEDGGLFDPIILEKLVFENCVIPRLIKEISSWEVCNENGPQNWLVEWLRIFPMKQIDTILDQLFKRYVVYIKQEWDGKQPLDYNAIHLELWLAFAGDIKYREIIQRAIMTKFVLQLRLNFNLNNVSTFINKLKKNGLLWDRIIENEIMLKMVSRFFELDNEKYTYLCDWVLLLKQLNIINIKCVEKWLRLCFDYLNFVNKTGLSPQLTLNDFPTSKEIMSKHIDSLSLLFETEAEFQKEYEKPANLNDVSITIKELVMEYCDKNDLFLTPLQTNQLGYNIYKISRDMKTGILVYFKDNILWVNVGSEDNDGYEPFSVKEIDNLLIV